MPDKRRRFCIFCGERPVSKTNEHVIPQWLIRLTGDPNRLIHLGDFINQKETDLKIAFNEFKFPACNTCNSENSALEEQVKSVIEKLLEFEAVDILDFDILLDWFDKVRVGLWLGYHHFLDKNFWGIQPNFHISERIGQSDRAILIYKVADAKKRINFSGMNVPAFAHSPTCFTLIINNLFFTNISTDFLLAKRAGLPYPRIVFANIDSRLVLPEPPYDGQKKLLYPILGFNYDKRCTVIAQPIYKKFMSFFEEKYSGSYIDEISMKSGKGKPIIQKDGVVRFFSDIKSRDWIPNETHDLQWMFKTIVIQTLQMQIDLLKTLHAARNQSRTEKSSLKYNWRQCINVNKQIIASMKEDELS